MVSFLVSKTKTVAYFLVRNQLLRNIWSAVAFIVYRQILSLKANWKMLCFLFPIKAVIPQPLQNSFAWLTHRFQRTWILCVCLSKEKTDFLGQTFPLPLFTSHLSVFLAPARVTICSLDSSPRMPGSSFAGLHRRAMSTKTSMHEGENESHDGHIWNCKIWNRFS